MGHACPVSSRRPPASQCLGLLIAVGQHQGVLVQKFPSRTRGCWEARWGLRHPSSVFSQSFLCRVEWEVSRLRAPAGRPSAADGAAQNPAVQFHLHLSLTLVFTVFLLATAFSFPKSKQQWNPQGVAPTTHHPGRILPGSSLYRI